MSQARPSRGCSAMDIHASAASSCPIGQPSCSMDAGFMWMKAAYVDLTLRKTNHPPGQRSVAAQVGMWKLVPGTTRDHGSLTEGGHADY